MSVEEIIKDLEKLVNYLESYLKYPKEDERYDYAKSLIKYLKDYERLRRKEET